jgi:hypothetical protein
MNQRIRQLAEQADKFTDGTLQMVGEFHPDWHEIRDEKFAELVVRECIGVVNRRYMGDNNREDMEVRRCVEDLKKHFGVE